MLLLLLSCAWFPSAECRAAQDAQTAAWALTTQLAQSESDRLAVQARAAHAKAAQVEADEADVPPAPDIETTQIDVSQETYTRALVAGGSLADAASAAQRAELTLRTRKVLAVAEAETRRTNALTARINAWREAEAGWRDAGGAYLLAQALVAAKAGEGVGMVRAPVQAGPTLVEPTLPPGAAPMGELLQGASKAHAAREAAASGTKDRHTRLQRVLDHGTDLLVQVNAGTVVDPELLSASNEGKLVLGKGQQAQKALDDAIAANEALDKSDALVLAGGLPDQLEAARKATTMTESLCR